MKLMWQMCCLLLLTGACASNKPSAKQENSYYQNKVIPGIKSRAIYFTLSFTDSIKASDINYVKINEQEVHFDLVQRDKMGSLEVFIPEHKHADEYDKDGERKVNPTYTYLIKQEKYTAHVQLNNKVKLIYPDIQKLQYTEELVE